MEFTIDRDALLKPLQAVIGVVEKKQTMPVLANILVEASDTALKLTTTDSEIELIAQENLPSTKTAGKVTIPGKKMMDICKSFADGAPIQIKTDDKQRVHIRSGQSKFHLSTLPAESFPSVQGNIGDLELSLKQKDLLRLLKRTHFAMGLQDVRYFLNGTLWEINQSTLTVVSTDGHRLATSKMSLESDITPSKIIVPRKAVIELMRILEDSDERVKLTFGKAHIRAELTNLVFTSNLLEGQYPDYRRVIPTEQDKHIIANKNALKQTLARAAILSNEKYRTIRLSLNSGILGVSANNPEHETAHDEIAVDYQGEPLVIGFNVNYLLDILGALDCEKVSIMLSNANGSLLMHEFENTESQYVVMPVQL